MLGNDLIDLQKAAIDSNWERKGYLDKIFSHEEKLQILNSENPSIQVWLFWSMKEAVYKIINRETGVRFYAPKAFDCKNSCTTALSTGKVHYDGKIYLTQSTITSNFIHTIALSQKSGNLVGSVEPTRLSFSEVEVLYLPNTTSYVADFNSISTRYILTKNERGIPELTQRNSGSKKLISISHHGNSLAIACLLTENG